jgi:hypothetical protein
MIHFENKKIIKEKEVENKKKYAFFFFFLAVTETVQ